MKNVLTLFVVCCLPVLAVVGAAVTAKPRTEVKTPGCSVKTCGCPACVCDNCHCISPTPK